MIETSRRPCRARAVLVPGIFALASCVSSFRYEAPDGASLRITGNNSNFFSEAYEGADCVPSKHGHRLATFYGPTKDASSPTIGRTVRIPAGKPFILTHHYIDARFAQNRACSVTVSFTPERGKSYQTFFYVDDQVNGCDAIIAQEAARTSENVPSFRYSDNLCLGGTNMGKMNRRPVRINWEIDFQRMTR